MTEAEWLACDDPKPMLSALKDRVSERRFWLFSCACWRRVWALLPDEVQRRALEASERIADGVGTPADLTLVDSISGDFPGSGQMVLVGTIVHLRRSRSAVQASWVMAGSEGVTESATWERARAAEVAIQVSLLRDVVGNPFRPVTFDPAWRTSDVVALATGIYKERAFDQLPILADALQDAGCDTDDLLGHLRDPAATHVRGCWALDLVLGKE